MNESRANASGVKSQTKLDEKKLREIYEDKLRAAQKEFGKRPNIVICGYTGSGKTSLIQAILGDLVPDEAIGAGAPCTMGFDCYENDLVRIFDSRGMESGDSEADFCDEVRKFIRSKQGDVNDVDNHIHLVWYTISGPGARVTSCDQKLISEIFNPQNTIVVITKDDITSEKQRNALKQVLLTAGVPENHIVFCRDLEHEASGCKELMALSYEMLPEAYKDAFMSAQQVDLEAKIQAVRDKQDKAIAIITTATVAAGAAGAVPIPFSDAAILVPIQLGMIASLAGLYGLGEEAAKQSAMPFVAKAAGMFMSTSLLKLIPGLGSVVNGAIATTLTGGMGWYVQSYFEKAAIAKIEGKPIPELALNVEALRPFLESYKKNSGK